MAFEATKHFALTNVRLKSCSLFTSADLDSIKLETEKAHIQSRKWVEFGFVTDEGLVPHERLKTMIHLGIRLVRDAAGGDDASVDSSVSAEQPDVLYHVEASFAVDFLVRDKSCTEEELALFVRANATHIAWPFWREHVFSVLRAASLPPLEVPLMAQVKDPPKIAPGDVPSN